MTYQGKIPASRRDFLSVVWPVIGDDLGGGEIVPVEGEQGYLAHTLDVIGGIDAIQILGFGLRGIQQRTQPYGKCWETFTLNRDTGAGATVEAQKRKWQIDRRGIGIIYPALTIQAYLSKDHAEFLGAAAIDTEILYGYLWTRKEGDGWYRKQAEDDGATFTVVKWDALLKAGRDVRIWDASGTRIK